MLRVLFMSLILVGCGKVSVNLTKQVRPPFTYECKGEFCKYTSSKNKISTCYKNGPPVFTIDCKFYEDL